jgi:hypothetical protein
MYEANQSGSRFHVKDTTHVRTSEYAELNNKLHEWYLLACSKNIFPSGSQLIEKAKQIAERLGNSNFKGSNGWLEKWFNVKMVKLCGESGDICGDTIDSWLERLPELVDGYQKEDIWNFDETGVFFGKPFQTVVLGRGAKSVKEAKRVNSE